MLFNPAYFLLNAEVANGRERRRKWQEVEGKEKCQLEKYYKYKQAKQKKTAKEKAK